MNSPQTSQLVQFLSAQNPNAKFLDRLKIVYRPYICPFDELLRLIPKEASVFDIGCGSGQFALLIAEYSAPKKIKGVEIDAKLVTNAHALLAPYTTNTTFHFEQYNGTDIPEDIADYNIVTMIDVGHHIPRHQQVQFFTQLYARMSSGSRLIYKDINASSPLVYMNKLHDLFLAGEIGNELSQHNTKKLFEQIGFTITHESAKRLWWYPHFTLIATKP